MDLRVGPTVFENRNGHTKQADRFSIPCKAKLCYDYEPIVASGKQNKAQLNNTAREHAVSRNR
jgi:hypothetical protein